MTVKTYEAGSSIGDRILRVQALKAQIDALEQELDSQKAYLQGHAIRQGLTSLKCEATTLTLRERLTWFYSQGVKDAEKRLKARKTREQEDGTAINTVNQHLVVTISAKAILAAQTIGA